MRTFKTLRTSWVHCIVFVVSGRKAINTFLILLWEWNKLILSLTPFPAMNAASGSVRVKKKWTKKLIERWKALVLLTWISRAAFEGLCAIRLSLPRSDRQLRIRAVWHVFFLYRKFIFFASFFKGLTLLTAKTFERTQLFCLSDGHKARFKCILMVVVKRVSTVFWETETVSQNTLKNTDSLHFSPSENHRNAVLPLRTFWLFIEFMLV